jgi:hypothetical protein
MKKYMFLIGLLVFAAESNAVKVCKKTPTMFEVIYRVGAIYISTDTTNPHDLFGFGTWEEYAQGRAIIGAGIGTDSNDVIKSFSPGEIGGEYNHTLTVDEMPSHFHYDPTITGQSGIYEVNSGPASYDYNGSAPTSSTGGSQPHNNLPPYVTVYIWRRTS